MNFWDHLSHIEWALREGRRRPRADLLPVLLLSLRAIAYAHPEASAMNPRSVSEYSTVDR